MVRFSLLIHGGQGWLAGHFFNKIKDANARITFSQSPHD